MGANNPSRKEQTDEQPIEASPGDLAGAINRAQGLTESLLNDLPPTYAREVEHLATDLEVLERWTDDADDGGVGALAGATTVVETAQFRVDFLQEAVGDTDPDVASRLGNVEDALGEISAIVAGLEITTTAYVTYVNRLFADRYLDAEVQVSTLLIAGIDDENIEEKVDEFGLFPMDGLFGQSVEDLAFPASWDTDLSEEHRTYWTSTSDGGKIA